MTGRMLIAYILYYTGLVGSAAYVLMFHITRSKMTTYLFTQDLKVRSKIVPCGISWLLEILGFTLLALVVTGLAIGSGAYAFIVLLVVVYTFLGILMFKDACKHLELQDGYIIITEFGKEKQYLRSEICTIKWRDCRGITGKQLVITFNDGKAHFFNMDHYRGVQNTYNDLTS